MKRIATLFVMLAIMLGLYACAQPDASGEKTSQGPIWQEQYNLGVRYLSDGEYEEAIIAFNAAIEIDPMQADAYLNLANTYIGINNFDAAKEILEKGYELTGSQLLKNKLAEVESGNILDFWGNVRKWRGYDETGELRWYHIYGYDGKQAISVTTYNADGVQTGYWDGFRYDEQGRQICTMGYSGVDGCVIGYNELTYDENGNVIQSNGYASDGTATGYGIYYYDEAGRCIRDESYHQDGTLYFINEKNFDGDKLVSQYSYNGDMSFAGHTEYRYDENGELISMIDYNEDGEIIVEQTMGH